MNNYSEMHADPFAQPSPVSMREVAERTNKRFNSTWDFAWACLDRVRPELIDGLSQWSVEETDSSVIISTASEKLAFRYPDGYSPIALPSGLLEVHTAFQASNRTQVEKILAPNSNAHQLYEAADIYLKTLRNVEMLIE